MPLCWNSHSCGISSVDGLPTILEVNESHDDPRPDSLVVWLLLHLAHKFKQAFAQGDEIRLRQAHRSPCEHDLSSFPGLLGDTRRGNIGPCGLKHDTKKLSELKRGRLVAGWLNGHWSVHPFDLAPLLKTVYTRAGVELTDPQESCKLKDIKIKSSSGVQPMLRSQTVIPYTICMSKGKSVQEIAQELHLTHDGTQISEAPGGGDSQTTAAAALQADPYKEQIQKVGDGDHCTNCEVIFARLQKMGYTGGISILKEYVHPLRPAVAGHAPVQRYETKPGEQVQFDWGEFVYEQEGKTHKFYGFTAILGYSRMRFVTFVKRCDTPTLIRCLMEAFEYFGGLTKTALTDRMKSVCWKWRRTSPGGIPVLRILWSPLGSLRASVRRIRPKRRAKSSARSAMSRELMGRDHLHGSG